MAERLRVVAEESSRPRVDLLGEQTEGSCPATERLVQRLGLVKAALVGEVVAP